MSRDRTVGDTFYVLFTTRAFASGIPTTLAGTPVVSAYEDAGLTQITAGITLGVDHDGVTGLNLLTIVATGGNGYETLKDYGLVITTGTVGGVSVVGEVVGHFSLGLSAAAVDLANGTDGLGALDTAIGAIPTTAMRGTDSAATSAKQDTMETTLGAIPTTAMRGTDNAALASVATEARLAELDAANLPTDVAAIPTTAMRGTDSAALASVATEARLAELDAANLPADVAAIPTTAMRGTDSAALASVATEARLAELDAANLPADIAAIPTTAMRGTDGVDTSTMRGTDSAALATALATAQLDLDKITGTDGATLATAQALYAPAIPSEVLTQVNAALDTAIAELAQAAPTATPTIRTALMLLYMMGRNNATVTATEKGVYNDAGTKIAKSTLSDDGTTFTDGELVSGA